MPISNNEEDIPADNPTYLWKTTMFFFAKSSTKEPSSIVVLDIRVCPLGRRFSVQRPSNHTLFGTPGPQTAVKSEGGLLVEIDGLKKIGKTASYECHAQP